MSSFVFWIAFAPLVVLAARRGRHLVTFAAMTIAHSLVCSLSLPSPRAVLIDAIVYAAISAAVWLVAGDRGLRQLRDRRTMLLAEAAGARERLQRFRLPTTVILDTLAAIEERLDGALIQRLAQLLRRLLDAARREEWTIDEELDLADALVRLWREKTQSPVHLAVEGEGRGTVVPGTLFTPVLEQLRENPTRVMIGAPASCRPVRRHPAGEDARRLEASGPAGWKPALLVCLAAVSILVIEQTGRGGFGPIAVALPLLRVALWLAPLLVTRSLVVAALGAVLGESAFFAFVAAMWPGAVPPFFSSEMAAMVGSSLFTPVVTALAAGALLRARRLQRERLEEDVAIVQQERDLAAARLELLEQQLQPHFLFNSLTSLAALASSDPARARLMAQRLRGFYGRTAARDERTAIELRQEIAFTREYLEIERVRFGARLQIDIDVDPDCEAALLPPLLLQPLAENAVKHGVASNAGDGWVHVHASRAGDGVRVVIRNSRGAGARENGGFGLANARDRLTHAFGGRGALETSADSASFAVSIRIPATMPA